MSVEVLEPDYQWKAAASQEGVDYGAVQKSFMDQSYGVVANKAKILFQDPFRLGFEIVHRNEKATKMVGVFAFRVNENLLYAPTFFVNGEIKPADMLYRADVKRFVPLTEDWCAYLVRGVQEQAGGLVDKNRYRQADAYMDRLAYPQRVKYASEETFADRECLIEKHANLVIVNYRVAGTVDELSDLKSTGLRKLARQDFDGLEDARDAFVKAAHDGSLFRELMQHCADDTPVRRLLPEVINETGPEALEKLAAWLGDSANASRYLASHYTKDELETVDAWMAKEASDDRPVPAITLISSPGMAKSAASRERVFDKGYDLVDDRPEESLNTVVEEVGDGTVKALSSPGKVQLILDSGDIEEALLVRMDHSLLRWGGTDAILSHTADYPDNKPNYAYFPADKELLRLNIGQDVFGDEMIDQESSASVVEAPSLRSGKCYVALSMETNRISPVFCVEDTAKDGDSLRVSTTGEWGEKGEFFYAAGRDTAQGPYISDETKFLEVKCKKSTADKNSPVAACCCDPECDKVVMNSHGIDQWIRSAGGVTSSRDVTVKANRDLVTFDIEHREGGTLLKSARDLGMLEAHLVLAEDFSMTTDMAGQILDKAIDHDVTYRVYDSMSKAAYVTRQEGMQNWIESFDPELNVKLDAPQVQVLSTYTPQRMKQQSRYGDTYQRVPAENAKSAKSLLPMQAILSESPESLAQMSEMYDLPHIFDHGCVGQLATISYNIVDQIKKYIPDIEAGVDRYFRILYLLRFKPAEFEELYGKDDLVEFEDGMTELASRAGDNLLQMLQQFQEGQYSAQEN